MIGCGRVGSSVALDLQASGWEVSVVDEKEEALARLGDHWQGAFVVGHGMDIGVLREAGIEGADAVVVATNGDNTNIVIAQIAKEHFKVPRVIARIMDPARATWYAEQDMETISPTKVAIEMFRDALGEFS